MWRAHGSLSFDIVFLTKDGEPDRFELEDHMIEEIRDNLDLREHLFISNIKEVKTIKDLPQGWGDACPADPHDVSDHNTTCAELLEGEKE
jgi:hypothetical protein